MSKKDLNAALIGVLWDFDGTIMDTEIKNFSVLRRLIPIVTGKPLSSFNLLMSIDDYRKAAFSTSGWRDLYKKYLGLTNPEISQAGQLWSQMYNSNTTALSLFPKIRYVITSLHQLPQGIVSSNDVSVINRSLKNCDLLNRFSFVIGGQTLPAELQKPHPHMLLNGIEMMAKDLSGNVLYIGDHPTDFIMVGHANTQLASLDKFISVIGIAVSHSHQNFYESIEWPVPPQFFTQSPSDILTIVEAIS